VYLVCAVCKKSLEWREEERKNNEEYKKKEKRKKGLKKRLYSIQKRG
jgi:hypothetical protein